MTRAIVSGDPRWATFKQAADEHSHAKKGAKSVLGIFYKPLVVADERAEDGERVVPLLKTFHAFHASEIEGLPAYKPPIVEEERWTRPEAVAVIIENSGVTFRTGDRAFYSPPQDLIQLPPDVAFPRPEYWAARQFTNWGHSTGDPKRMCRDMIAKFGLDAYACERGPRRDECCFRLQRIEPANGLRELGAICRWLGDHRQYRAGSYRDRQVRTSSSLHFCVH